MKTIILPTLILIFTGVAHADQTACRIMKNNGVPSANLQLVSPDDALTVSATLDRVTARAQIIPNGGVNFVSITDNSSGISVEYVANAQLPSQPTASLTMTLPSKDQYVVFCSAN